MGRQLAEHPCTFASTFESCSFHVKQSKQSARRRIVKTKVAKKNVPCNSRAVYSGGTASFADADGKRQNYGFPTRGIATFCPQKVAMPRGRRPRLYYFLQQKNTKAPRGCRKKGGSRRSRPKILNNYLIYGVVRNCIAASRSRGWRVPCRSTCPCANRRGTRRPPCSAG